MGDIRGPQHNDTQHGGTQHNNTPHKTMQNDTVLIYKKRLVSRINPNLLLKIIFQST
jgi:hypothetical protein